MWRALKCWLRHRADRVRYRVPHGWQWQCKICGRWGVIDEF